MRNRIPYIQWREALLEQVPSENRIGTSLMLLDSIQFSRPSEEGPLIFDVTTAVFVMSGSSDVVINMKCYHVEAPSFFIILPDTVIQFIGVSADADAFCIVMSKEFFTDMISDASTSFKLHNLFYNNPVAKIENANVFSVYKDMLRNLLHSPENEYKIEAARHLTLTIFYGYMLKRQSVPVDKAQSRQEEILENFLNLLRTHYSEHREVSFYADKLCLTAKYLSTAVKEASGRTPLDWIDEYVTMAAKAMLKSSNMSIDEISVRLNFASLSLFGKFFKRVTGQSPREYRVCKVGN